MEEETTLYERGLSWSRAQRAVGAERWALRDRLHRGGVMLTCKGGLASERMVEGIILQAEGWNTRRTESWASE